MAKLEWAASGTRFFETGVSRGVLYPANEDGVAWNGLISVDEDEGTPNVKEYFLDGINYLNVVGRTAFTASLTAFSTPREFDVCDGIKRLARGLSVTQQPRRAFGLSYRTRIGNDIDGSDHAYKIHLVYNALATSTGSSNNTFTDESAPVEKSWSLTTLPPSITGYRPTAHVTIDSRQVPARMLTALEDILYGSSSTAPRLIPLSELIELMKSEGPIMRRNNAINPSFRLSSGTVEVFRNLTQNPAYLTVGATTVIRRNECVDPRVVTSSAGWVGITVGTKVITNGASAYGGNITSVAGTVWTVTADLTAGAGSTLTGSIGVGPTTGGLFGSNTMVLTAFSIPAGTTQRISNTHTLPTGADGLRLRINSVNAAQLGLAKIDNVLIERSAGPLPYFDGAGPSPVSGLTAAWVGTANASASTLSGPSAGSTCARGYNRPSWIVTGGATDGTNSCRFYPGIYTPTQAPNVLMLFSSDSPPCAVGDYVSARFRVRLVPGTSTSDYRLAPRLYGYTAGGASVANIVTQSSVNIPATGTWVDVVITPVQVTASGTEVVKLYIPAVTPTPSTYPGILEFSNIMIQAGAQSPNWFYGASAAANDLTFSWVGSANASASIATGVKTSDWGGSTGTTWRKLSVDDGHGGYYSSVRGQTAYNTSPLTKPIGTYWAASCIVAPDPNAVYPSGATVQLTVHDGNGYVAERINVLMPSEPTLIVAKSTVPTTGTLPRVYIYGGITRYPVRVARVVLEQVSGANQAPGAYFDGSTLDEGGRFYSWEGAANSSASILKTWF